MIRGFVASAAGADKEGKGLNVHRMNPSHKRHAQRLAPSLQALGLAACLCLSATPAAFATDTPTVVDDPAYAHAQQLVEVAPGRRLNLYCVGRGSPTTSSSRSLTR